MGVILDAIKFNYKTSSHNTDALTIRRNKVDDISTPEWKNGISVNPEDSLAAYSRLQTRRKTITIQARFHTTGPIIGTAEVRAIDATAPPGANVLGEVKRKGVTFNVNGVSGFIKFELKNLKITKAGVGIYFIEWQWQYRTGGSKKWINMQVSKHKIYVVLETPKETWNQEPGSDHLPWTEVLDYSCAWAGGAKTRDEAAGKITEQVYALGNSVIEYDCPGFGDTHYCYAGKFDCTKFIERMQGETGNGQHVNCTDMATVVTTFSNILGCELWNSQMEGPWGVGFKLNPILAIGSSTWQPACGWPGFGYHEVAWKNNCDVNDNLFDACLQIDGDSDPTIAPHTPLLATNLKFGGCSGALLYRRRLSPDVAGGCTDCVPDPTGKFRRTVK